MSDTALQERAALVTGGAQGLGLAIARGLLDAGAAVALLDRNPDALAAAKATLGDAVLTVAADVTREDEVQAAAAAVAARFGRLDILVNNAAVRFIAPVLEQSVADWRTTLDVNLTGPFLCVRAVVPYMERAGKGKIVNVASLAGQLALSDRAAYSASKAGLMMLTKSIAFELGPRGISCNAIAPGVVETPLTSAYFDDPQMRATVLANTPIRRWGQPDDIAPAVVFLCGDGADYIQGETLIIDGGWATGKGF